jgi:hypothetical protein
VAIRVATALERDIMLRGYKSVFTFACSLALLTFVTTRSARAAIDANVTISSQAAGGGVFDYTLTLNNLADSTASIETLWFSWIPGYDFMSSAPLSFSAPSGWSGSSQHVTFYTDGYSAQYVTTSAALAPGNSLQFGFTSLVTPTELAGNDSIFHAYPEQTTYVYSVSPESGVSEALTAQTIPEPSSLALVAFGSIAGLIGVCSRKLRKQ